MPDPAVRFRGVTKRFGGVVAVASLDLDIPVGSVHGLIGPNGAGKTTVVNLVSGHVQPTEGSVHVLGERVDAWSAHVVAAAGVARTFQHVRLFPGVSVVDTVLAGRHRARRSGVVDSLLWTPTHRRDTAEAESVALGVLARVGLRVPPRARADSLAYADRRRLEIARALATEPTVLLLDEPTAGMHGGEAADLVGLLEDLRDGGMTLVIVEHNLDVVRRLCDDVTVMDFGRALACGRPDDVVEDPRVRRAYLGGT